MVLDMTNVMFKNMKGYYNVYQCPKCLKVVFLIEEISEPIYCCECNEQLKKLDLKTAKVELQL